MDPRSSSDKSAARRKLERASGWLATTGKSLGGTPTLADTSGDARWAERGVMTGEGVKAGHVALLGTHRLPG
jgi:hypothetical protein